MNEYSGTGWKETAKREVLPNAVGLAALLGTLYVTNGDIIPSLACAWAGRRLGYGTLGAIDIYKSPVANSV